MRILVITNHFWPENFRVNDLAVGMVERGHEVCVLSGIPNYPEGKFYRGYGWFRNRSEEYRGVQVHRIPLIPRGNGSGFRLAVNYLTSAFFFCLLAPWLPRHRPDVVFVFETSPATIGLPAVLLKRLWGTPVVFWVLDLWPESITATKSLNHPWILAGLRSLMRWLYRNCDQVLISSKGFHKSISTLMGTEWSTKYFPNWIEPCAVAENSVSMPNLPDGFRVLFTGNVGAAQDFETIVAAARLLRDRHDLQWIIVGEGRRLEWLRNEIKQEGLSHCMHCLGRFPADQMDYFLQRADALLLPLKDEPIFSLTAPGKLQAYMASGKPILGSIAGEGASLIQEAECGVVAAPSSPQELASALLRLFELSQSQRDEMGRKGRSFAEKHFDRNTQFDQLDELLRSMAWKS